MYKWACLISVITLILTFTCSTALAKTPIIRTFLVFYSSQIRQDDIPMLAKYDLLATNRFNYDDVKDGTWNELKKANPNIKIFIYEDGSECPDFQDDYDALYLNTIARYNNSRGHSMGNLNQDNPGLFLLNETGGRVFRLADNSYSKHIYHMDFGNRTFQLYWLEAAESDILNKPWKSDGIIIDNCAFYVGGYNSIPIKYNTPEKMAPYMLGFVLNVTAGLHSKNSLVWTNIGTTRFDYGYNGWLMLDDYENHPDFVMEEGAFAVYYGKGDTQFYPETDWKRQVDLLEKIRNINITYISHTNLDRDETGTDNYGKPVTFWQTLWYSLASFLLGKKDNAYFMFKGRGTSYNNIWWFDEYGIDLGEASGKYHISNYNGDNIYWREFDKGYVYVNPTAHDVYSIKLPQLCKQLRHDNLATNPLDIPNTNEISLYSHHAAILLKSNLFHRTYYVDAVLGNDSWSGAVDNGDFLPAGCEDDGDTSDCIDGPWRTVSKVNSMTFNPGDRMLFRRGRVWREELRVPSSGEKDNPILFGSYGYGPPPEINGADIISNGNNWQAYDTNTNTYVTSAYNWPTLIVFNGVPADRGTDKNNLQNHEWFSEGSTLYFRDDSGNPATNGNVLENGRRAHAVLVDKKSYIVIENMTLKNHQGNYNTKQFGVLNINNSNNIIIKNCNIANARYYSLFVKNSFDVLIENCSVSYGLWGIAVGNSSFVSVRRNRAYKNGWNRHMKDDGHGIGISSSSNITVEYNNVYDNGFMGDSANVNRRNAIVSWQSKNVTIRYNKVYDNYAGGITISAGTTNSTGKIYYNLIYNNGRATHPGSDSNYDGIRVLVNGEAYASAIIYNNVVFNNNLTLKDSAALRLLAGNGGTIDCTAKNNIFYNNIAGWEFKYGTWNSGKIWYAGNNNIYYRNSNTDYILFKGFRYPHTQEWNDYVSFSGEYESINKDPLFVDASNKNFHLKAESPAIDAGAFVGLTGDFEGRNVPVDGDDNGIAEPDIGAFEYNEYMPCPYPADLPPCDKKITIKELIMFIKQWKSDRVSIFNMIDAIKIWMNE